uniref:Uncharacterized protein n=1 Tax=Timema cristinae TaxID=61476 RepID=A0A7R9D972_TIMCR|nr:unnamed protein product [Timema cristinae]
MLLIQHVTKERRPQEIVLMPRIDGSELQLPLDQIHVRHSGVLIECGRVHTALNAQQPCDEISCAGVPAHIVQCWSSSSHSTVQGVLLDHLHDRGMERSGLESRLGYRLSR